MLSLGFTFDFRELFLFDGFVCGLRFDLRGWILLRFIFGFPCLRRLLFLDAENVRQVIECRTRFTSHAVQRIRVPLVFILELLQIVLSFAQTLFRFDELFTMGSVALLCGVQVVL